ncbi:MAG: formylglycine-generating enzyme family protein [Phycisphaerales bacterium]|nr:MAG: formylglycine-generating enzyme family protein [Phycisphaerales bacterium]
MPLRIFSKRGRRSDQLGNGAATGRSPASASAAVAYDAAPPEPLETDPLRQLWQQGRFAVILREADKWRKHTGGDAIVGAAASALEKRMALVPEGTVTLPTTLSSEPGAPEIDVDVEPFLLAATTVSNAEFQRFVDAAGYDELELWPKDIWPHLIEFHDQTGSPGPRFWRQSRHSRRLANHPVVGVSWFEARAYALWAGLRLPTEVEWQMAASWHIRSSADVFRRFPWGDALDRERCNLWLSGIGETAPVDAYANGAAPNNVLQLVGNVWQWNSSDFEVTDVAGRAVLGEMPMKGLRGGAFDTYFESQATSGFRTGLIALARTHNVSFRCAMDLKDATWLHE